MKRVVHVIQNLNYGGMERLLADIIQRADPTRFECHVLVLQYAGRFSQELDSDRVHLAEPMSRWSLVWPRSLARDLRSLDPDVVHTHSGVWYKASRAARLAGVPATVHTDHGRPHPEPAVDVWIDRFAARHTDTVVAVSSPLAEHLRRRIVRGRSDVLVIPNGVDTDRYRPAEGDPAVRESLGVPPAAPVIGSIGRLEPVKAYHRAIEALAVLRAGWTAGPAPVLFLAGDGSERERLRELARERGVESAVFLPGWRDDVRALHAMFTIFTMASLSEGTSVSLLEAMSAGLCPVVTDVGGNGAVLGPALAHRLVRPDDPDALATAWKDALSGPGRRAADAAAARARVVEEYSLSGMVSRYEALYAGESTENLEESA